MKNNNQVIIERDMFCPYCKSNSAVLISETIKQKKTIGCAAIGCKDGTLLYLTGGCWAIISGFPLFDIKYGTINNIYGFCPCCGNTYPVIKPEESTFIDKIQNTQQRFSHVLDQAKGMMNNFNNNNNISDEGGFYDNGSDEDGYDDNY